MGNKVKAWQYKLPLSTGMINSMSIDQVNYFIDNILKPALDEDKTGDISYKIITPDSANITSLNVSFYDTPDFEYNKDKYILRYRQSLPDPDTGKNITLKYRSPDKDTVKNKEVYSNNPNCDDIKLKHDYNGSYDVSDKDKKDNEYYKEVYALSNQIKSDAKSCPFPVIPTTAEEWGNLYPPINGLASGPTPLVNNLYVQENDLSIVELTISTVDTTVTGDLTIWVNANQNDNPYAQYIAAEFSYTIKKKYVEEDNQGDKNQPEAGKTLISNLSQYAYSAGWLGSKMKTSLVYDPPFA